MEKQELVVLKKELQEDKKEEVKVKEEMPEVEKKARSFGWLPEDEFEEPEKWVSAKEFLYRGELLGRINNDKHKIHELEDVIKDLSKHNEKVFSAGYQKAVQELKQAKKIALKEGDAEVVEAIEEELEQVTSTYEKDKKEREETVKRVDAKPQLHPAFEFWLGTNSWYGRDKRKTAYADIISQDIREKDPHITFEELLSEVGKEVRERFEGDPSQRKRVQEVNSVEGDGKRGTSNKGKGKFSESDLSDEERKIMNTFIKTIPGFTKEKYIKDMESISNKGGR